MKKYILPIIFILGLALILGLVIIVNAEENEYDDTITLQNGWNLISLYSVNVFNTQITYDINGNI